MITNNPESEPNDSVGEFVRVRKDLPSGTIVLSREASRNALNRAMIQQLQQALDDFHQERLIRAVILTGSGDSFSSGTDMRELSESATQEDAHTQWHETAQEFGELIETMLRFPKPIIAAVNGTALGAGAGLVVASDVVVAGSGASIGWPEARRGLVPSLTAPLLSFRVGSGLAARMMLTGEIFDCAAAVRMGLFHEQVENDLVWARASELANECAQCAPSSIQLTKQMLNETIGESLFTWHSIGAAHSAAARTTDFAAEGVRSFLAKSEPDWISPTGWAPEE